MRAGTEYLRVGTRGVGTAESIDFFQGTRVANVEITECLIVPEMWSAGITEYFKISGVYGLRQARSNPGYLDVDGSPEVPNIFGCVNCVKGRKYKVLQSTWSVLTARSTKSFRVLKISSARSTGYFGGTRDVDCRKYRVLWGTRCGWDWR